MKYNGDESQYWKDIPIFVSIIDEKTKQAGWSAIEREIPTIKTSLRKESLIKNLEKVKNGTRDLYF